MAVEGRGRAEGLWAQEAAVVLLKAVSAVWPSSGQHRDIGMQHHVPVQQGALQEATGTHRAGEGSQIEVGEGVPQQGTERGLRQLAHSAAQRLDTHMSQ